MLKIKQIEKEIEILNFLIYIWYSINRISYNMVLVQYGLSDGKRKMFTKMATMCLAADCARQLLPIGLFA